MKMELFKKKIFALPLLLMVGGILILLASEGERDDANSKAHPVKHATIYDYGDRTPRHELAGWLVREAGKLDQLGRSHDAMRARSASSFLKVPFTPKPVPMASRRAEDLSAVDHLIVEARDHLHDGRTKQALMSLIQARGMAPGDERIENLIERIERGASDEMNSHGELNVSEVDRLFAEGGELMKRGRLAEARKKYILCKGIIERSDYAPPIAGSLDRVLVDIAERLNFAIKPTLDEIAKTIDASLELGVKDAVDLLEGAKKKFVCVQDDFPENVDVDLLNKKLSNAIRGSGMRWLASAKTVESLSGCAKAVRIYGDVAERFRDLDSIISKRARGLADDCR